jgi:hypothetical protein
MKAIARILPDSATDALEAEYISIIPFSGAPSSGPLTAEELEEGLKGERRALLVTRTTPGLIWRIEHSTRLA